MLILIACLLWFVVSAYVLMFVQWMIGGDIDVLTGILGIGVFVGLGITNFAPPVPELQPLSTIALAGSAVVWPFLRSAFYYRDKRTAEIEGIRAAYDGFIFRPNNPSAMFKLARHLHNLGHLGHAYALAELALPNLPRQFYPDEHRLVATWRMKPPAKKYFEPITCVECGNANEPGMVHCGNCGGRYLLATVQGRVVSKVMGRKLLASWLAMVVAIGGMPLASRLPQGPAIALVISLLAVAGVTLYLAFRPDRGTA